MPADFTLDHAADDQKLLAQVVGYYHTTLTQTPKALDYLQTHGVTCGQAVEHFHLATPITPSARSSPPSPVATGAGPGQKLREKAKITIDHLVEWDAHAEVTGWLRLIAKLLEP